MFDRFVDDGHPFEKKIAANLCWVLKMFDLNPLNSSFRCPALLLLLLVILIAVVPYIDESFEIQ